MKKTYAMAAVLGLFVGSSVRADVVIYELGSAAANTLHYLGNTFVTGCFVLAVADEDG